MKTGRILTALAVLLLVLLCTAAGAEQADFEPADLPVVYLTIDGGEAEINRMNSSADHSYRCTGTMDILVPDSYSGDFQGAYPQKSVKGLKMKYIRGRGNGTWGMAKLPYKIKLEEKQNLFGMGKNKTWVLLANFFDNSLIRNRLTQWLGKEMGLAFTPQGVFVEVVMNGEYLGSYYLSENVQVGKSRVAIDELLETDTELPVIQGGYLLEMCPDDTENPNAFTTANGMRLGNESPSFDEEDDGWKNDAQMNYIRDYVQRAEDAIYAEGGDYGRFLDLQSLADIWWMNEFTVNGDAFRTDSAHLYKPRFEEDGSEGKLHFGPLWDFDESFGNAQIETFQDKGFNHSMLLWMDELRKKPEFVDYLWERWQVMDGKLEEIVREGGVLDQTADLVRASWSRDQARWENCRQENTQVGRNFDEEVEHIRTWINLRRQWINENRERLGQLNFTLTTRWGEGEEETYEVPCDTTVDPYDLEVPEAEGSVFRNWAYEDRKRRGRFYHDGPGYHADSPV